MGLKIMAAVPEQWEEIAMLIYDSTNAWYQKNRGFSIFSGDHLSAMLFCRTYNAIDPEGSMLIAYDEAAGKIAGSCFVHPRPTHVSLGIMNVHPDYFGKGVAPKILARIVEIAAEQKKPLRLVSSAMNLDSYSLYNRFGFIPYAMYQDMMIPKFSTNVPLPVDVKAVLPKVRLATLDDVPAIAALEKELAFIERPNDYRYFIENPDGAWKTWVLEGEGQKLNGVLSSVVDPGSCMLGPGVMRTEAQMLALIYTALSQLNASPVFLVPTQCIDAIQTLYSWGARNTELHVGQCLGECQAPVGITMPTFMPETC